MTDLEERENRGYFVVAVTSNSSRQKQYNPYPRDEQENFVVKLPQLTSISPMGNTGYAILSLIVAALLLSGAIKLYSVYGVLVLLVLSILLFVILSSASGDGKELSLPSTTYPLPPNLGHEGVSLDVENSG